MIIQKFFHANLKELYMDFNKHEQSPQIYSVGNLHLSLNGAIHYYTEVGL